MRVFCDDALEKETILGFAGHDAIAGSFSGLGEIGARMLLGIEAERAGYANPGRGRRSNYSTKSGELGC